MSVPSNQVGLDWSRFQPYVPEPQPYQAAMSIPEPGGVEWADYGKSILGGGASIVQGVGWLANVMGAEDIGTSIQTLGSDAVDYWNDSLSDPAKAEISKQIIRKNDETDEYEWGDPSFHTVGLMGAQSLLGTAAGMGAGAGLTKVLQVFANPFGRAALVAATKAPIAAPGVMGVGITAAAKKAAVGKLKLVDSVLGGAGFGAGEGSIGGISAGASVYDNIMSLSPEKLLANPRYKQIYESTDNSISELERHQYAADTVAKEASTSAGWQSGLTTALLGAPMGAYFGRILGGAKLQDTLLKAIGVGAAGEAAQEFGQSGAEQLISNYQTGKYDPDIDIWDDVLNAAVSGAMAGGLLGGVVGPAAVKGSRQEIQQDAQLDTAVRAETFGKIGGPLQPAGKKAIEAGGDATQIVSVINAVVNEKISVGDALDTLEQIGAAATEAKAQAEAEDQGALNTELQERGEPIKSQTDAERRWSDGDRIFAFHEMDEQPAEVTSLEMLGAYTPDQLTALPAEAAPEAAGGAQAEPEPEPVQTAVGPEEQPEAEKPAIKESAATPELELVNPLELQVDASTFQFKASTDAEGVSKRLKGVKKFDKLKAGTAIVYEDMEGKRFIVDGHQRVGLAKRAVEAGQDPADVQLPAYVLKASEGVTPEEATFAAATKNIAEGSGSAIDAAKVLRQGGAEVEQELPNLPPTSALVQQAKGLRNLDDDAFAKAVNEIVPERQAAIVGELIGEDGAMQNAAIEVLRQTQPANDTQARAIVEQVRATGVEVQTTEDLFGEQQMAESLYLERAKVLDSALKTARRDKATFRTLTNRKQVIAQTGENVLDTEANLAAMSQAEQAVSMLSSMANQKGPISDALNQAAKEVKAGAKPGSVASGFLETAIAQIEAGVPTRGESGQAGQGEQAEELEKRWQAEGAANIAKVKAQLEGEGIDILPGGATDTLFSRQASVEPTGHCFENCGRHMMHSTDPNMVLMHGYVVGQGPIEGVRFAHAWLERKNAEAIGGDLSQLSAKDADMLGRVAIDLTTDDRIDDPIELPAVLYRSVGQAEVMFEYSQQEALKHMANTGHFGPWEMREHPDAAAIRTEPLEQVSDENLYSRARLQNRPMGGPALAELERAVINPIQTGELGPEEDPGAALLVQSIDIREQTISLPEDNKASMAAIADTLDRVVRDAREFRYNEGWRARLSKHAMGDRFGPGRETYDEMSGAINSLQNLLDAVRASSVAAPTAQGQQDDMFGAPPAPEPAPPAPEQGALFSRQGKPLSEIRLTREFELEETGEIVEVDQSAEILLRQLDKRISVVEKLRGCIRA